ncbi:MAG TPA: hypothetical protein PL041_12870 [Melioribacteraceae bacterium]|nr:hypothetical protein [Melioribacteraceae bacterium]
MKIKLVFALIFIFATIFLKAQDDYNTSIYIIDSYVTPDKPYKFLLSFITDDSTKSVLVIENKYEFKVSESFINNHKIEVDLSNIKLDSAYFSFFVKTINADNVSSQSEIYEASMPISQEVTTSKGNNLFTTCLFGGIIFGIPEPTYVFKDNFKSFSLKKEIPLFSYYSGGYNYPAGYFNIEYRHIVKNSFNSFGIGYKKIFQLPVIEYLSLGLTGFTNFKGKNGLAPEISFGLFKLYDNFTLNLKYRYNIKPNEKEFDFNEVSLGLYSNFFSLNL